VGDDIIFLRVETLGYSRNLKKSKSKVFPVSGKKIENQKYLQQKSFP
jgi:hypothetical protein